MKPEKKPAVKSAVVKSAVTTRSIERDVQRRQQAAHRIIDRMDTQRPHIPRLTPKPRPVTKRRPRPRRCARNLTPSVAARSAHRWRLWPSRRCSTPIR